MTAVLSIRDLTVTFATEGGPLTALDKVCFDVPEKNIVGVVGESGCGKSTLINAILGLLAQNGRIDQGSILFQGEDIARFGEEQLRALRGQKIATVFQDPMGALNPVLSIGRQMVNIQYRSPQSRANKVARALDMLKKVRIPDPEARLRQYPHEFSGGMKQRIAIAMALMMEPALLIADEPTTALDATLEVATIELLKELQRDIGCSVLFISHHLGVVAELCDQVVVMYAGDVVERADVSRIFNHARHPYTEKLFECDPARLHQRARKLPTIPGEIPDLKHRPKGCIFAPRCSMVEARCSRQPPVVELAPNHHAACWLADPLAAGGPT